LFCNATYHHDNDDWQRHIQAFAVASSTSLNNMQLPQPIFLVYENHRLEQFEETMEIYGHCQGYKN
jgi:hypothetical protein